MSMTYHCNGWLISAKDAANLLGVSEKEVLGMVEVGCLTGVHTGTAVYITKASILDMLELGRYAPNAMEYPVQQNNGYLQSKEATRKSSLKAKKKKEKMCRGCVSTLSDGRFMVQIDKGKKENGRRNRESKSFRTRTEADAYLEKRLAELNRSSEPTPPAMPTMATAPMMSRGTTRTFEEYALQLLVEGIGSGTTRTTETHRRGLASVIELIGHIPMAELTSADIKKAFRTLSYHYADSNLKRSFNIVRLVVEHAVDNDDIPKNPIRKLKCPRSQKPNDQEKHDIYSDEDIQILFETSREFNRELYTMFVLLECTGMRPGEMRALEWECFDPEAKTIRIKQAITRVYEELTTLKKAAGEKEIVSVTKSGYGVRTLRLSDLAVEALTDWRERKSKSRNKVYGASPFIFSNRTGEFKSESACQCMLKRYRKAYHLGKMGVMIYKFRHTMCTRLILDGQPIPVIQRIMGDNTIDVIMRTYTHVNEEMALQETKRF